MPDGGIIACAVAAFVAVCALLGHRWWIARRWHREPLAPPAGPFTRARIREALRRLARSKPPSPASLKAGAMCYKMSLVQNSVSVVCTGCGAKTVHPSNERTRELERCDRLVQALQKIAPSMGFRLDYRGWCTRCREALLAEVALRRHGKTSEEPAAAPGADDLARALKELATPADDALSDVIAKDLARELLALRFRYAGDDEDCVTVVSARTLLALKAFFEGSDRTRGDWGRESPLQPQVEALCAVLAVDSPEDL